MRRRLGLLAAVTAAALFLAASSWAQATQYILRADPNNQADICNAHGLTIVKHAGRPDRVVVTGPDSVLPGDLVKEVRADRRVQGFEQDHGAKVPEADANSQQTSSTGYLSSLLANHTMVSFYGNLVWGAYANQPALAQIAFQPSGDPNKPVKGDTPGYRVVVAVIDDGVDPNHPALQGALLAGYDFTRGQPGASVWADLDQSTAAILNQSTAAILNQSTAAILNQSTAAILNQSTAVILNQSAVFMLDQSTAALLNGVTLPSDFGHGTTVAGLIHLIAPGAQIMPLKAFRSDGTGNVADVVSAVYYAVDNGADVINMSFSQDEISSEMLRAINYAQRSGVVCVASAGNNAQTMAVYPASFGGVIGVGSVSPSGALSAFSNYGPDVVTLVAPGEGLVSTFPGGHYAAVWGTSFSSALVSGTVAVGFTGFMKDNSHVYVNVDDAMDAISSVNNYDPNAGWGSLNFNKMSRIRHTHWHNHPH